MVSSRVISGTLNYKRSTGCLDLLSLLCTGLFPINNKYLTKCLHWVILAVLLSFLINQAHPLTIAYGARTNLLHFPLIFIMGRILTWKDVIQFGKAFLLLAGPMTWVVAQQFQADAEDIINTAGRRKGQPVGNIGRQSHDASGTFTFVSGIVFYYCFAVSFIIYGFLIKMLFPNGCSFWEQALLF